MTFSIRVDGVPTFSVAEVGFYEGAEKLLELWFHLPDGSSPMGIRTIPQYVAFFKFFFACVYITAFLRRASWRKLLKLVKCEVLSVITNDTTDAYLLR